MIGAGALDRRITVQRYTETRDPVYNSPVFSWADLLVSAPASVRQVGGREFLEASQIAAERRAVFTIRHADVTEKDRVLYDGRAFNITDVHDVGRRRFLELHCEAVE